MRTRRRVPLRVVIVEDSERILAHLAEELVGDRQSRASRARRAPRRRRWRSLGQGDWDLAILDLQLKQGNGLRVLKAVRRSTHRLRATIAVFTNYAFPQYRKRSLELGADYFFDKSRELSRVVELVEDMAVA